MRAILLILLVIPFILFSQEEVVEKTFQYSKDKEIDLNLKFADDIKITRSNDNKIHFKAIININDGKLNHAHEIDIHDSSYELDIDTDLDEDIIKDSIGWCMTS